MDLIHNKEMSFRLRNRSSRSAEMLPFYSESFNTSNRSRLYDQYNHSLDDFFFTSSVDSQISFKEKLSLSTKFLMSLELEQFRPLSKDSTEDEDSEINSPDQNKREINLTPSSSHVIIGNSIFTLKDIIEKAIETCTPTPEKYDDFVIQTIKAIKKLSPLFSLKFYLDKLLTIKEKVDKIANEFLTNKIKPWIAIDLDETLIHSELLSKLNEDKKFDMIIASLNVGINIRPYLREFLFSLSNYYSLVLFTAGEEDYAQTVTEHLGIKQHFQFILSRDYCMNFEGMIFIKDLNIFGEDANFLLIDNSIFSFANHLKNGVLVSSFYCDENDSELLDLLDYLIELLEVSFSAETVDGTYDSVAYKDNIISKNEKHFCFDAIFQYLDL